MKLFRFGELNKEKPGIVLDDRYLDASSFGEDYNEQFFESGGLERLEAFTTQSGHSLSPIPAGSRMGSPVARPSKIVCIGLNYADHARETGANPPSEPVIFFKSTSALSGPFDDIVIP
jgi:2-keto-4-pentenoate hydratase/2-oxohepta-3-ene-1,7-dioic acid hydratase in catechol pathway